jgi:hypothetical protein
VRCLTLGDGVEDDGGEVGHKVRGLTAQRRQVPHRPTGRHTHANAATLPGRALIDRLLNLEGAAATAGLADLLRLLGSLGFQLGLGNAETIPLAVRWQVRIQIFLFFFQVALSAAVSGQQQPKAATGRGEAKHVQVAIK